MFSPKIMKKPEAKNEIIVNTLWNWKKGNLTVLKRWHENWQRLQKNYLETREKISRLDKRKRRR